MSERCPVPDLPPVESPPPTPVAARDEGDDTDEPRLALNRLAHQLARARNRKVLFEYLRLRRLLRAT
jgi:hypothetical protein